MFPFSLIVLFAATAAATPPESKFVVPNFKDLTVKTRITFGMSPPSLATNYFKGARQRNEHHPEHLRISPPYSAVIMQCDQKAEYLLNEDAKTYLKHSWGDRQGHPFLREPNETGSEVVVTIDTEDTGERRQMGSFDARRVKTFITVEPSKGAAAKPGKAEIDGWYIDLFGVGCRERDPESIGIPLGPMLPLSDSQHDHVIIKRIGNGQRGYAVGETATTKEGGNTAVKKVELLEFSEQPLDPSLFEVPPGYSPKQLPKAHSAVSGND
jgi:hypothetical protein